MSLAKIEIEQTAPDRWRAEVEVGGLIARRETVTAETFRQLMIAVEGAYSDMLPKPKDEPAESAPGIIQAEPERRVTTSIDDRPVDVTPVPDRAVAAEHRTDSAGREQGASSDRNLVDPPKQPVPQPQRPAAQDDRRLPRHPHHSGRHR